MPEQIRDVLIGIPVRVFAPKIVKEMSNAILIGLFYAVCAHRYSTVMILTQIYVNLDTMNLGARIRRCAPAV